MNYLFRIVSFLAVFLFYAGSSHALISTSTDDVSQDNELSLMVRVIQENVLRVASGKPFKFKAMNESLKLTAAAVQLMSTSGEEAYQGQLAFNFQEDDQRASEKINVIVALLKEAHEKYPENHIAILLQAMVVEVAGGADSSNIVFEEFLKRSRAYSKLDEKILKFRHFQQVRRSVLNLLEARNITFHDRPEEIEVVIPFENFYRHITSPNKKDVFLNWFLLGFIVIGGLFLIICSLNEYRLIGPFTKNFGIVYLGVWIAYGAWIIDLVLGLPWGLNRHQTVSSILILLGVFYAVGVARRLWSDAHPHIPEGFRLCPHCKAISPKTSKICIQCNQTLET